MTEQRPLIGLSSGRARIRAAKMLASKPAPARMRARQLWNWIYVHGARDFAAHDQSRQGFSRADGGSLHAGTRPGSSPNRFPATAPANGCSSGGPGIAFETVFIPEEDRGTLCVSSQVGCTLNCRFCHTGTQKLVRNLTPYEIAGQVMVARDASRRLAEHERESPRHQCGDDGHGRAAVQFRQCQSGACHRGQWRRAWRCPNAASRCPPRASCR